MMRLRCVLVPWLLMCPLAAQAPARWTLVPEARIGTEGDPNTELADVRGVEASRNGNVLVLDFKTQDIRVFSPAGKYLKTIGRKGSGPGEFLNANGFVRAADGSIWVNDPSNARYSVRGDDGEYVRDVASHLRGFGYFWSGRFDAAGRLLNTISVTPPGTDPRTGSVTKLERRNVQTQQADTVAFPTCLPAGYQGAKGVWIVPMGRSTAYLTIPFMPGPTVTITARNTSWCAFGGEYVVYRLGLERGDTQTIIRGKAAAIPVTAEDRDAVIWPIKETLERGGATTQPPYEEIPKTKPVIIGLVTDDQDRLWVRLTPTDRAHTRYDVYTATGRLLANVDIPELIRPFGTPLIRGDAMYAVVNDADDVPHVVRYRIEVRR